VLEIEIERIETARACGECDVNRARVLDHEREPDLAGAQARCEWVDERWSGTTRLCHASPLMPRFCARF
jgi:hypothetical protein